MKTNKTDSSKKLADTLVVVRAVIIDGENRIFLVKRSLKDPYCPGTWGLPGAKLSKGRSVESFLLEQIQARTGYIAKIVDTRPFYHGGLINEGDHYQKYIGKTRLELVFLTNLVGGTQKLEPDYIEGRWVLSKDISDYELAPGAKVELAYFANIIKSFDDPKVYVITRCLMFDSLGRLLLLKRASDESYPNLWEIPGGKLKKFEDFESQVTREVFEETGISVEFKENDAYIYSNIASSGHQAGATYLNIIKIGYFSESKPKIRLTSEHYEYRWVELLDVPKYQLVPYLGHHLLNALNKFPK